MINMISNIAASTQGVFETIDPESGYALLMTMVNKRTVPLEGCVLHWGELQRGATLLVETASGLFSLFYPFENHTDL